MKVERIVAAVEKLSDEPFPYGFQKLTGAAHTYRIRIGDYRVVYEVLVESKIVLGMHLTPPGTKSSGL
jgi:mRNA interferase RelE/StbE